MTYDAIRWPFLFASALLALAFAAAGLLSVQSRTAWHQVYWLLLLWLAEFSMALGMFWAVHGLIAIAAWLSVIPGSYIEYALFHVGLWMGLDLEVRALIFFI